MRIESEKQFHKSVIENGELVTIPDGYERGIWNNEQNAVFLIASKYGRKTITTCIPDTNLGLKQENLRSCDSCTGYIHEDCVEQKCRFCGSKPVLRIESES